MTGSRATLVTVTLPHTHSLLIIVLILQYNSFIDLHRSIQRYNALGNSLGASGASEHEEPQPCDFSSIFGTYLPSLIMSHRALKHKILGLCRECSPLCFPSLPMSAQHSQNAQFTVCPDERKLERMYKQYQGPIYGHSWDYIMDSWEYPVLVSIQFL